jgi:hypothetical protein
MNKICFTETTINYVFFLSLIKKNYQIFIMIKFAYWKCRKYSRGQKKVRQRFFANLGLFTLSMVTIKIFIYLL